MDQRDRHRALADRARDALERARAHVARHEHAGHASSRAGTARASAASRSPAASRPARMKPRSSRATTPSSQSVRGDGADEDEAGVDLAERLGTRRRPARRAGARGDRRHPRARPPQLCVRTSRSGRAARSARSGSATSSGPAMGPRTSIVTSRVAAEVDGGLPRGVRPPMMTTCWSAHARASVRRRAVVDAGAGQLLEARRVDACGRRRRRRSARSSRSASPAAAGRRGGRRPRRAGPRPPARSAALRPGGAPDRSRGGARSEPLRPAGKPR